ncbi:MAG TPA: hypothetical protein VMU36_04140 [Spirochaetia bacterium]|nr:hypothetical protein [Spirochaetia bacterium]
MDATKKLKGRSRAPSALLVPLLVCLASGSPDLFAQAASSPPQPLPNGFRGITLGMDLDQVKRGLVADPLFGYRGDPDVSLLPQTQQYLIESSGPSYVHRAYFQFADRRLLTMILVLDPEKLDYFSMFSALSAKYGRPASVSPEQTVWQSDSVRLSLEKPLTVKYLDPRRFAALVTAGSAPSDLEKLSREKFIEQF